MDTLMTLPLLPPDAVAAVEPYLQLYTSNPWLCWGFGPSLAVIIGFLSTFAITEWLGAQSWMQRYMIVYGKSETRAANLKKTQDKISWSTQAWLSVSTVAGPTNILGLCFSRYALEWRCGMPDALLPTAFEFALHFFALALIADFFLYWGHRIQHMSKYLWEHCHSFHHRLATPSAAGTAYIEARDALLQSGIPLVLSAVIVGPHPVTLALYFAFHVSNNALNHSGLDCWWLDIVTLKCLPLRCGNNHHDAHHRFTGFGPNSKNLAEMFWLWDWVFGTYSNTAGAVGRRQGAR